jgi:hypothetical protein
MKQKYAIIRDDDQNTLIVREYAELDKEMMSLLCEETYSQKSITAAIKEGHTTVVDAIRTNNMYPPTAFAEPIAKAIESIFAKGGNQSAELFFDDKELFVKKAAPVQEPEETDEAEKDVDVDDLLEADLDDEYADDAVIKDLKTSLKVAEEDDSEIKDI